MSFWHDENLEHRPLSSRRLMLATVLGGLFTGAVTDQRGFADEVNLESGQTLTAQPAVQRLVRPIATKTVQLAPVSADFNGTVVQAIASDPRGELLAVAGDDHAIRVMDSVNLKVTATLQGHSDLIQTLDFSPSGDRLVSAGNDRQMIIWDRTDGFSVHQRFQGGPAIACVRFSPDGKEMAAVGFENKVYLIGRNRRSGQPQVECDCKDLRAVAFRYDNQVLAVAGRTGYLHLFDRTNDKLLGEYSIHSGRVRAIQFAGSSSVVVSVGEDGAVVLFDTQNRKKLRTIKVTRGKLFSVSVLDPDHVAVAGSDNVIRVVNVSLGRTVEQLPGHTGSIATLASNGSLLFSGGYDATLRRWQLSGIQDGRERIAGRESLLDR